MAAAATLSAARDTKRRPGEIVRYLMAASKVIYKGALVGLASGLAQPFADAASERFVGIAREDVTSASSGSYYVTVEKVGVFDLVWYDDDAIAAADIGVEVYGASDSDVTPNASGAATTAKAVNDTKVGVVEGYVGAVPQIRIDAYVR